MLKNDMPEDILYFVALVFGIIEYDIRYNQGTLYSTRVIHPSDCLKNKKYGGK